MSQNMQDIEVSIIARMNLILLKSGSDTPIATIFGEVSANLPHCPNNQSIIDGFDATPAKGQAAPEGITGIPESVITDLVINRKSSDPRPENDNGARIEVILEAKDQRTFVLQGGLSANKASGGDKFGVASDLLRYILAFIVGARADDWDYTGIWIQMPGENPEKLSVRHSHFSHEILSDEGIAREVAIRKKEDLKYQRQSSEREAKD